MSIHSSESAGGQVESHIDYIKKHAKYKVAGTSGYFLSKRRFEKLEEALEELMIGQKETSLSPDRLVELHNEISELRQANQMLEDREKSLRTQVGQHAQTLRGLQEQLASKEQVLAKIKSEHVAEKAKLVTDLKGAQKVSSELEMTLLACRKQASDPEDVARLGEELKAAKARVTQFQSKLSVANQTEEASRTEVLSLKAQIKKIQFEKQAAEAMAAEIKTKGFSTVMPDGAIPTEPVEIQSKLLKPIIGPKGIEWLQQNRDAMRADVRERA